MPSNKPWFRMYSRLIYDPKVRTLDSECFRLYVGLLCLACENKRRGYVELEEDVPWDPVVLGQICGVAPEDTARYIGVLAALHLVTVCVSGVIWFHKWDDLQYDKPSDRPEEVAKRVTKYRKLCPTMPIGNANETPLKRGCNDPDPDTESELEKKKEQDPSDPPVRKKREAGGEGAKECVGYFHDGYKAKYDEKLVGKGGMLGKFFKQELKQMPLEEVKSRIDNWFDSTETFIVNNTHNPGIFMNKFTALKEGPLGNGRGPGNQGTTGQNRTQAQGSDNRPTRTRKGGDLGYTFDPDEL
jgi:hypothetical protein